MNIFGVILSVVMSGFLIGLFVVQRAAATVTEGGAFPAASAGMIYYFGEIQSFVLKAGEPFMLMILGATLVVVAVRLRQSPEENPNS
jgi:hypothetical protein